MNRWQIQGCQWEFLKNPIYTLQKISDLNRKSQVNIKLGESFYYLQYLGICKSQNVLVAPLAKSFWKYQKGNATYGTGQWDVIIFSENAIL